MSTRDTELDLKISAWLEQQRRKALKEAETDNRIMSSRSVTISREFGCEGYPLAVALKTLLEDASGDKWTIFDRALIERLENEYDLSKEFIDGLGGKETTVDRLKSMLSRNWAGENEQQYQAIADTIFSIASAGHAIIVGRGSGVIAQDLPNCYNIRLVASLEHRIRSFERRTGCTTEEARQAVVEKQESSTVFYQDFLAADLSEHTHYHGIFNTEKLNISTIASAVTKLIGY